MLIYSPEILIKAHSDRASFYYNHSYDRYVRNVICGCCGHEIGEQEKYLDFSGDFKFVNSDYNGFGYCPYCGDKWFRD